MKKRKKRRTIKWLLVLVGLFLVFSLAGCTAVMSVGNQIVDLGKVKEQSESSVIYDKDGNEITKLYIHNRDYVDFQHIPKLIKESTIDVEDARFYSHGGIDLLGIARAIYKDLLAGGAVEGASTITQQLAKNVYTTGDKTLLRKTKEAIIAMNLEKNYSKDQILEFYLNDNYMGHGTYGVQAASKYYFGKDLKDLDVAETATLVGLYKAPNTYDPVKNYDKSLERRKIVLSLMVQGGTITKQQADQAAMEKLKLVKQSGSDDEYAQSYIDYLLQEVEEKYHISEEDIYRGGYQIYTAFDPQAQHAMAKAFENAKLFPRSRTKDIVQGGMVILDPHTGGIVAMTGGRDYVTKGTNRAVAAKRSPGSSFKPLAVYAPALEQGWGPYSMLKDEKMTFPGGYSPDNWHGDGYLGEVTMYDALKRSKNVPAVWLLNEIGIDTSFRYLDLFGVPYDKKKDRKLGIALGGLTYGVSPLDMAKAYSAFANNGVIIEPHAITKIKGKDGQEIKPELSTTTAVSEQTAYYMTQLLQAVVNEGTGSAARMNRPVAGKTGTTQMEGTNGNRDAWFVGYTPEYVGAVWMGFDDARNPADYMTTGSEVPARFFRTVMSEALAGRSVKSFTKPAGVQEMVPPVQLPVIGDVKAEIQGESIHLVWTVSEDKRISYRIYRYLDDPAKKEMVGETQKGDWVVPAMQMDQPVHYYVTAYDTQAQREGDPSNIVEVVPGTIQNPVLSPPDAANPNMNQPNSPFDQKKKNTDKSLNQQDGGNINPDLNPPSQHTQLDQPTNDVPLAPEIGQKGSNKKK